MAMVIGLAGRGGQPVFGPTTRSPGVRGRADRHRGRRRPGGALPDALVGARGEHASSSRTSPVAPRRGRRHSRVQRPTTNVIFGSGLSNDAVNGSADTAENGLPIDSSWISIYQDQGIVGEVLVGAIFLLLLVIAFTRARGPTRALALYLIVYCLIAGISESGLGGASQYLLDLTVAASSADTSVGHGDRPLLRAQAAPASADSHERRRTGNRTQRGLTPDSTTGRHRSSVTRTSSCHPVGSGLRPDGGIGRRGGLKSRCSKGRAGSSPAPGTTVSATFPQVRRLRVRFETTRSPVSGHRLISRVSRETSLVVDLVLGDLRREQRYQGPEMGVTGCQIVLGKCDSCWWLYPGAGKGTQAKKLAAHYRIAQLSSGELLRAEVARDTRIGRIAANYLRRGDLVPDELVLEVLSEPHSGSGEERRLRARWIPKDAAPGRGGARGGAEDQRR